MKRTRTGTYQAIVYNNRLGGQQSLGSFDTAEGAALLVAAHKRYPTELKLPAIRAKRKDVRAQLPSPFLSHAERVRDAGEPEEAADRAGQRGRASRGRRACSTPPTLSLKAGMALADVRPYEPPTV